MVNLSTCSETKFGLSSSSNIKRIYRSPSKANMFESFSKRHIKYFYYIYCHRRDKSLESDKEDNLHSELMKFENSGTELPSVDLSPRQKSQI